MSNSAASTPTHADQHSEHDTDPALPPAKRAKLTESDDTSGTGAASQPVLTTDTHSVDVAPTTHEQQFCVTVLDAQALSNESVLSRLSTQLAAQPVFSILDVGALTDISLTYGNGCTLRKTLREPDLVCGAKFDSVVISSASQTLTFTKKEPDVDPVTICMPCTVNMSTQV